MRDSTISANGRWLATGSHWLHSGGGAKVWDLHARPPRLVKELPVGGLCGVQFSPDGNWLLTLGGGPRLWKVGTWEEGPGLAGRAHSPWGVFSADGKLLALGHDPGVIRLVVPASGQEVARLTAPVKSQLAPRAFTPDAGLLTAIGTDTGTLHVFDLRAIRTQLAGLGLDWDPPSIPPPAPAGDTVSRQLEGDTGDRGMTAPQRRDYWRRHVALCSLRLAFNAWDVPAMLQRGTAHLRLDVYTKALPDFAQALSLIPAGNEESFAPGRFTELAPNGKRRLRCAGWHATQAPSASAGTINTSPKR